MAIYYLPNAGIAEDQLKAAYEFTRSEGIDSQWIEDVETDFFHERGKDDFIVLSSFEGEFFKNVTTFSKQFKFRVLGPLCVTSCLKRQKPLPKMPHPVHNITLLDVVACCTSVGKEERTKLLDLITLMGGRVSKDFTSDVTHLIAGEVGSQKYTVASNLNRPILLPEWVHVCWKNGSNEHCIGTDTDLIRSNKCPMFKGLTICVSGLADRQKIKQLVVNNGGCYSPELNMRTCTHLLLKTPQGEKFDYAKQWKIHCVHPDWLSKCISIGHWTEEAPFLIEKGLDRTTTQLLQNVSTVNCTVSGLQKSTLPSIDQGGGSDSNKLVNKISKAAQVAEKLVKSRESLLPAGNTSLAEQVDADRSTVSIKDPDICDVDISISKLKRISTFLDGCRIYLDGFSQNKMENLRKIINAGGATRYNKLNDNITHVVLGELITTDIKNVILLYDPLPIVVSGHWLVDSFNNDRCMNEDVYSLLEFHTTKKTKRETSSEQHATTLGEKSRNDSVFEANFNMDEEDDDDIILQQYREVADKAPNKTEENCQEMDKSKDDDDLEQKLLSDLKFSVQRFRKEEVLEITQLIHENGGSICEPSAADFIIVPITHYNVEHKPMDKEVTICWLEQSLEENKLVDCKEKFIFRPFYLEPEKKQLLNCVVSISQFTGIEREHLLDLCSLLGACVQDYFVRANSGDLKASTHLILKEPKGNKYEAALKWDIPAVTEKWLYACAESGKRIPVDRYVIDCNDPEDSLAEVPCKISMQDGDRSFQARTLTSKSNTSMNEQELNSDFSRDLPVQTHHAENGLNSYGNQEVPPPSSVSKRTKTPLKISKSFRPSFDLSDAMNAVNSPSMPLSQRRKSRASRGSFGYDNMFSHHIQKALERGQEANENCDGFTTTQKENDGKENNGLGILTGVIIVVSKKLYYKQTELHNLAGSLGAESRFMLDESCTHFIHEGRAHDSSRDFQQAKAAKKWIVSPHWLEDSAEKQKRLDESLYPFTYNPRYNLPVVSAVKTDAQAKELDHKKCEVQVKKECDSIMSNDKIADINCSSITGNTKATSITEPVNIGKPKKDTQSVNEKEVALPLEDQRDLQKKLEEVMEATKAINGGLRRSKRLRCPSVQAGEEQISSRASLSKKRRRLSSQKSSGDSSRSSENGGAAIDSKAIEDVEPSQGDVISYDDPAERQERERILAQIKMAGCSQDPEGNVQSNRTGMNAEQATALGKPLENITESTLERDEQNNYNGKESIQVDADIDIDLNQGIRNKDITCNTTKAMMSINPPINLQITHPVAAYPPVNLLEEEDPKEKIEPSQAQIHYFLLSSITPQEKADYSALIEQLGGKVFESSFYNPQCTHVVIGAPNRNEKFLASVAAGKWILHTSYLEASREAGYFVNEEDHEWGSGSDVSKLAAAARRWRIKLAEKRMEKDTLGAFEGWRVFLCVDQSRQPGFKRLLEAGGAVVLAVRPPFPTGEQATHMFVDLSKAKTSSLNIQELFQSGILVLKPDYIAEYLTQDPAPLADKFLLPEVRQLEVDGPGRNTSSVKRKNEEGYPQKSKQLRQ